MPIPSEHSNRSIYHFTHIDNLSSLLHTGFLANNHPKFPRTAHRSVAEQSIQRRRAAMNVPCGPGGVVHDYVPLYFGSLSLMLLSVVNRKNIDQFGILYFEFPISLLLRHNVIFTDASANTIEPPNFYSDPNDLKKLSWQEIDSRKWSSANDSLRHQRMAEILVHQQLPLDDAQRIVVWNDGVKEHVTSVAKKMGVSVPPLEFEARWDRPHYFLDFIHGSGKRSLVTGPQGIAMQYRAACEEIEKIGRSTGAPYETPKELLKALRKNFGCLPDTAELVGLKSANNIHKRTVDGHTLDVVEKLKSLPEFEALPSDADRRKVELAAYLHDIGKGPKSRWVKNDGVQQVDPDHPIRAMPMMVTILTEQIKSVTQRNAELLLKLVCYHDLVGEVLGKGRDEHQITDVAASKLELDMLFALGKADATSLREEWWSEDDAPELYERCLSEITRSKPTT